jgi:catechol-2,3-dioxygenase
MKIRLQEIELGIQNTTSSKEFYNSVLGLDIQINQDNLKVFKTGIGGIDFNTSTHLPAKTIVISFLTEDLAAIIATLTEKRIFFEGPKPSHLGMTTIEFKDPDGYLIRINQPSNTSPDWLIV